MLPETAIFSAISGAFFNSFLRPYSAHGKNTNPTISMLSGIPKLLLEVSVYKRGSPEGFRVTGAIFVSDGSPFVTNLR
jgi:hypothetical protein